PLYTYELPDCLRCSFEVAEGINALVRLENGLREGRIDRTVYTHIQTSRAQEKEAVVSLITEADKGQLNQLGSDAFIVAIVLSEEDKAEIQSLTGLKSVFTSHEARGLQFASVLL